MDRLQIIKRLERKCKKEQLEQNLSEYGIIYVSIPYFFEVGYISNYFVIPGQKSRIFFKCVSLLRSTQHPSKKLNLCGTVDFRPSKCLASLSLVASSSKLSYWFKFDASSQLFHEIMQSCDKQNKMYTKLVCVLWGLFGCDH